MNRSDEAIERVLAGLRDAEAPVGMERRILEAVEDRASAQSRSGVRGWKPLGMLTLAASDAAHPWAWRAAVAGIVAVSLAIAATYEHGHGAMRSKAQSNAHSVASGSLTQVSREGIARDAHHGQTNLIVPNHPVALTKSRMPARKATPINAADSVSLAEMRAPSHPAPEEPLTQQEKLLLRIVHKGDPQQMAMLNPEIRARQDAESEAEFQKFVEQSMEGDSE